MSFKEQCNQFFSAALPTDVKVFRMAVSIYGAQCLISAVLSALLRCPGFLPLLLLAGGCVSAAVLWLHHRYHNVTAFAMAYLFLLHILMFPFLSIFCENALYDFPVYFIEGIAFTAIILKGWRAIVMVLAEIIMDLYCINLMTERMLADMASQGGVIDYSYLLYFRIMLAIGMTGIGCGLLIAYRNRLLREEMRKGSEMESRAEQVNYAKDMFLVNVSHEIRTPLNAILGMSESLMDLETDDRIKENAFDITNSSKALLAIINDLMDFSRIDYNDMRVEEDCYYVGEMFDELINLLSVRFSDYNMEFFVDLSPGIPEKLWGDGAKFRQILSTLATGLAKSMASGEIYFTVEGVMETRAQISLRIELCGRGVFRYSYEKQLQEEEQANKAYGDQEGALVKKLIRLLGGIFHIEEKANERIYRFEISQGYEEPKPIVESGREDVCILFYENSIIQGSAFAKVLKGMGLRFCQVSSNEYFYEECVKEQYTHIMIASERYEGMKDRLAQLLPPQSVILVGAGAAAYDDALIRTTFSRPVNCLNMDALLGNRKNSSIKYMQYRGGFICPEAKIMVVDDNAINLEVASNILKKYEAQVLLMSSGKECLNYLQDESVDLILLDYMMPEMDGIDTLKRIRALPIPELMHVPVVALTANAVSGAREMFMEAGFDEYISKPIELNKFDRMLREYLDRDKIIFTTNKEAANED